MTFKKNRKALKALFVVALALLPCGFAAPVRANDAAPLIPPANPQVVPFETLGIGSQSGCTKRALFAISDEAEWKRVWGVHTQALNDAPKMPQVDFSRQTVLAILSGERRDGKSLKIAQIVSGPADTVVYFWATEDEAWTNSVVPTADKTEPFHFAVIDKAPTPLRFVDALELESGCRKCAGG
jgi:hypothetical protein